MRELMVPGWKGFDNRRSYWAYLFARLKPGVSVEQARAAMNGVYRPIINDVEAPLQKGMSDQTMARFRARTLVVEPGRRGQSQVHKEAKTPLILLFSITGIVLLIACANIANLLLARGAGRATEMAVRLSLGATPPPAARAAPHRVVRAGGARRDRGSRRGALDAGAHRLAAAGRRRGVAAVRASAARRALRGARCRSRPACSSGCFPRCTARKPDLVSAIKAQAGQPSGARAAARFRSTLVTAQIALSMALLISAGLFVKSLMNVSRVDLGVKVDNVVTFGLSPDLNGYDPRALAGVLRADRRRSWRRCPA